MMIAPAFANRNNTRREEHGGAEEPRVDAPVVVDQANHVIYGPTKISTLGGEETPVIAIDSNGNVHIVWTNATYLIYKMFDNVGNVLIDETILNPVANPHGPWPGHVRRPSMAIDAEDRLHIVFHGFSLYTDFGPGEYGGWTSLRPASEVIYVKIDPYSDDRDGDAADFFTITMIPETIISTDDRNKSRAPNIAQRYGRLHVSWFDGPGWSNETEIHYLVLDLNGNEQVSESALAVDFHADVDWGEPEIVVDSNGNAHVFWVTEGWTGWSWDWRDVWYVMADGSDGSVLIAPTQLTDSGQQWRHSQPLVAINSGDIIHVAYHDSRYKDEGGEAELFMFKVEPYLDDRNGDSADPDVIVIEGPTQLTMNDGYRSFRNSIAIDPRDRVHIPWVDNRTRYPEVHYMMIDCVPEERITFFEGDVYPTSWHWSSGRRTEIAVTHDMAYITFHGWDDIDHDYYIYLVILSVPYCTLERELEPVGGEIAPANTLYMAAPYLTIIALAVAGTLGVLKKRKII